MTSTTDGTKDRRRECGLWVFNLRPSLNLWIERINLFWLRLRRAGRICEICGRDSGYSPRVRAAFLADAERSAGLRFRAAARACRESACFDAAARPSRFKAFSAACERFRDGLAFGLLSPFFRSCFAFRRVSSGTLPFLGTGNFTPARLAFERPMAIACLVDRAPCSPLRIVSISSRTNSPACVEADFPSRLSRRIRSMVSFLGMGTSQKAFAHDPASARMIAVDNHEM